MSGSVRRKHIYTLCSGWTSHFKCKIVRAFNQTFLFVEIVQSFRADAIHDEILAPFCLLISVDWLNATLPVAQWHRKRVLCTWESTHVHFWHEYEQLHLCPFWCYFTGIPVCVYISYNAHKRCSKETSFKWSDVYVNLFSVLRSIP